MAELNKSFITGTNSKSSLRTTKYPIEDLPSGGQKVEEIGSEKAQDKVNYETKKGQQKLRNQFQLVGTQNGPEPTWIAFDEGQKLSIGSPDHAQVELAEAKKTIAELKAELEASESEVKRLTEEARARASEDGLFHHLDSLGKKEGEFQTKDIEFTDKLEDLLKRSSSSSGLININLPLSYRRPPRSWVLDMDGFRWFLEKVLCETGRSLSFPNVNSQMIIFWSLLSAQKTICISTYGMTDDLIGGILKEMARKLRYGSEGEDESGVFIIADKKCIKENWPPFKALLKNGGTPGIKIKVFWPKNASTALMHNKTTIIDGKSAFNGSLNFSWQGRKYNIETVSFQSAFKGRGQCWLRQIFWNAWNNVDYKDLKIVGDEWWVVDNNGTLSGIERVKGAPSGGDR